MTEIMIYDGTSTWRVRGQRILAGKPLRDSDVCVINGLLVPCTGLEGHVLRQGESGALILRLTETPELEEMSERISNT